MAATSFSHQELQKAEKVMPAPPESLTAKDGISLPYRCYLPAAPDAAVLFYQGGGLQIAKDIEREPIHMIAQANLLSGGIISGSATKDLSEMTIESKIIIFCRAGFSDTGL